MSQFSHISHKSGILSLFITLIFKVLRPALNSETIDLQQIFRRFFYTQDFWRPIGRLIKPRYSAMAMIKQLSFLGERSWLCVGTKPRDMKPLFMIHHLIRKPHTTFRGDGLFLSSIT